MNTEDFDRLLQLMLERGFSQVEFKDGGQRIAMKLPTSPQVSGTVADAVPVSETVKPGMIESRSIGKLLASHPLHKLDGKVFAEGARVAAGEPVAYVQSGDLLSAIVAPSNGTLGRRAVEPGQLVGYSTPVFEFLPDNDQKPAKG